MKTTSVGAVGEEEEKNHNDNHNHNHLRSVEEREGSDSQVLGPWAVVDEIDGDDNVFAEIKSHQGFRRHCLKRCVRQLCDVRGPGAFIYLDGEFLDKMRNKPIGMHVQKLAQDVINRYNSELNKNLELKKILNMNCLSLFYFMKIEVWDKTTDCARTFQLAAWDEACNGQPVVGLFKDVTVQNIN